VNINSLIFVLYIFFTFFHNGVQAYIHFEAYPLLAYVGKPDFATYLEQYERRLMPVLMLPTGLLLLTNLFVIFSHSDNMSAKGPILTLVLELALTGVTLALAAPVYNRIKQAGQAAGADMQQLMRLNLLRLALATISSLAVIYVLVFDLAIGHS
jgi:hypothetical protein